MTLTRTTPTPVTRTQMCENESSKGSEFKRKVERLAKEKKLPCRWDVARGKGSHGRLFSIPGSRA